MKKKTRALAISLSVLIALFALPGCSQPNSGNTSISAVSETSEPDKLTMFFGDSGLGFPDGIKPDDNDFIHVFEKAANVDVEMIVPAYQDFSTKFNLMMSSGEIPDLVHSYDKNEINRYGLEGAFQDWLPLIEQSAELSALYDEQMREMMVQDNGAIYALQTLSSKAVEGSGIRIDLINEVNNGHIPTTTEEMYQFFKNIKAKYPDAVPLSTNNGKTFYRAGGLFESFGVHPWGLQLDTAASTEYYWFFEHHNAKQAVEYYKRLYDEGILYKEFATISGDPFLTLMKTKKLAYYDADCGNIIAAQNGVKTADAGGQIDENAVWVLIPTVLADGVTLAEANQHKFFPLGFHCVAINAKADDKATAAAVRFVEALSDIDTLAENVWGREGIEYNIVNSERVVNTEENSKTNFRLAYQFFRSFYFPEDINFKFAVAKATLDDDQKKIYEENFNNGIKALTDEFNQNPGVVPADFVSLPDLSPKMTEAQEAAHTIVYRAIMGEITMDQYDAEVASFVAKYKDIKDAYNAEIQKYVK